MHVAVGLLLALLVIGGLVLAAGLTPFIGIPLAVLALLAPFAWAGVAGRLYRGKRSVDRGGTPTTGEATYSPVVDPAERP